MILLLVVCSCVVANSRRSESDWSDVMQQAKHRSRQNRGADYRNIASFGVLHSNLLGSNRDGTQPLDKISQFINVECSEHRHGEVGRDLDMHRNVPTARLLALQMRVLEKRPAAGEQLRKGKACIFYI